MSKEHDPVGADYSILHNEEFDEPFRSKTIDQGSWLFTGGRQPHSLNGDWAFTLDLHFHGLRSRWYEMEPKTPGDRIYPYDWDPFNSDTTPVPSNWQTTDERAYYFEGAAWYAKTINREELPDGPRKFLRVGAAAYECKVFLNGSYLGRHLGASTPFFVELTEHLRDGPNYLFLCVDNTRTLDRVPMRYTDWFNYGGLYRDVEIFCTPETLIRDFFVALVPDGTYSKIRVEAEFEGLESEARLEIPELGVSETLPVEGQKTLSVIDAKPELWSPGNPKLYETTLHYGEDTVHDRVGFREIRRDGTQILLNGESIFLRGVAVHEDDENLGRVMSEDDLERRFADARELGCNFLRLAHYPHHEAVARLADEAGLLLWEEVPVYWAIDFSSAATLTDAANQLSELVRRDRNRASVVIWSMGNENPDSDLRLNFMSQLVKATSSLDPTRLTTAACLIDSKALKITDRLADVVDIISFNEYYGWYNPNFGELEALLEGWNPDRPVVISETGADAVVPGQGGPEEGLFSEKYMGEVYRNQIAALRRFECVKGLTPWVLYDFRAERRQNIWQGGWNRKGLIAQDKSTRKLAFGILKNFYDELKAFDGE